MEIVNKYNINYLSKINKHILDVYISFEEENHIYTVNNNNKDYISVTTFIHSLFPGFNENKIVNNILKSKKYNNPDYKYYNKTKDEILNMWEENRACAANLGTQMHYFIECYYDCLYNPNLNFEELFTNNQKIFTLKNNIEYKYFINFVNDNFNLIPYRTEWCIYDTQLKLAGSIDMVFTDENNKFYIYDWKRSKEIKKTNNNNETSTLPILDYIPNSNYWHYTLQLNIYKRILEINYNIIIDSLYLVIIYPENKNYMKINVPIMNDLINELFTHRYNNINN
tara:strand:+ start:93 stop:938 length:846 start_codon:yes stop_codon:yes gene_type:complete